MRASASLVRLFSPPLKPLIMMSPILALSELWRLKRVATVLVKASGVASCLRVWAAKRRVSQKHRLREVDVEVHQVHAIAFEVFVMPSRPLSPHARNQCTTNSTANELSATSVSTNFKMSIPRFPLLAVPKHGDFGPCKHWALRVRWLSV